MVPQTQPDKPDNSARLNLLISLFFHIAIVAVLIFFAARQGLLGDQLKKITIQMVKEKPPEKPKEPEKPKVEPPKAEPPKTVEAPKVETAKAPAPRELAPAPARSAVAPPVAVAPPPSEMPALVFGGGEAVQTSSDPVELYKSSVEHAFLSQWHRPGGMADDTYVAEVEVAVDRDGKVSDPVWKKSSGNTRWDDSVKNALSATQNLDRPPPAGFPPRVLVRFDVADSTEPLLQNQ
jgi:outer membrane biosynthesis protein TonB